jgi:hypothetical protein
MVMAGLDTQVEELFDAVCRQLTAQHPQDELGRMLHRPGIKTGGTFYAFTTKGDLVVKLPVDRVDELIARGVGQPCTPRPGHPMRQWVRLAPSCEQDCAAYMAEARRFVVAAQE